MDVACVCIFIAAMGQSQTTWWHSEETALGQSRVQFNARKWTHSLATFTTPQTS